MSAQVYINGELINAEVTKFEFRLDNPEIENIDSLTHSAGVSFSFDCELNEHGRTVFERLLFEMALEP